MRPNLGAFFMRTTTCMCAQKRRLKRLRSLITPIKASLHAPDGARRCPAVPIGAHRCPSVPGGARRCPSVPGGARRCPMVPIGARWCPSVPIYNDVVQMLCQFNKFVCGNVCHKPLLKLPHKRICVKLATPKTRPNMRPKKANTQVIA